MESPTDPVVTLGGTDPAGQLVRWIPRSDNRGAAAMWRGICFEPSIEGFTEQDFLDNMKKDLAKQDVTETYTTGKNKDVTKTLTQYYFSATVERVPEFTIGSYEPKPLGNDDGLSENRCWPKDVAGKDPGFVLLTIDPYYGGNKPPYDYAAKYEKGVNGD